MNSVAWFSIYLVVWSKIFGHMVFIYLVVRFQSNWPVSIASECNGCFVILSPGAERSRWSDPALRPDGVRRRAEQGPRARQLQSLLGLGLCRSELQARELRIGQGCLCLRAKLPSWTGKCRDGTSHSSF